MKYYDLHAYLDFVPADFGFAGYGLEGKCVNSVSIACGRDLSKLAKGKINVAFSTDEMLLRDAAKHFQVIFNPSFSCDDPLLEAAHEHGVAFEFPLSVFLEKTGWERAKLFGRASSLAKLCVTKRVEVVVTSGARNEYGVRHSLQLVSFACSLGFSHAQAIMAVSASPRRLLNSGGFL